MTSPEQYSPSDLHGDPRDFAIIGVVPHMTDAAVFAKVVRYPSGNPRNVVLIARNHLTPITIASALKALSASRNAAGLDHDNEMSIDILSKVQWHELPPSAQRAVLDYQRKLFRATPHPVRDAGNIPSIRVNLGPPRNKEP
jgi:hypothetical protein